MYLTKKYVGGIICTVHLLHVASSDGMVNGCAHGALSDSQGMGSSQHADMIAD